MTVAIQDVPPQDLKSGYTVALTKGQGILDESLLLLREWDGQESALEVAQRVAAQGLLGKATSVRVHDIVRRVFAPRFLLPDARPAQRLVALMNAGVSPSTLLPLFFLYAVRANTVLRDLMGEVYWGRYQAGSSVVTRDDILAWLFQAQAAGKMSWSQSQHSILSRCLMACLVDFGFARDTGLPSQREIASPGFSRFAALYLSYDLHFSEIGDKQVLDSPDWALWGLEKRDVLLHLRRLESAGHLIVQSSGDLIQISWKYENQEQWLQALAKEATHV